VNLKERKKSDREQEADECASAAELREQQELFFHRQEKLGAVAEPIHTEV
jgi:hypothetical protein